MGDVSEEKETLLIRFKLWLNWDMMDGEASLRRVGLKLYTQASTVADSEREVSSLK